MSARWLPLVTVALVAVACSSSSSSSSSSAAAPPTGDKTTFCKDNAALDLAFFGVNAPDQALAVAKDNASTITEFGATAPSDIKATAQVLVDASQQAAATNDATKFQGPGVQAAGETINLYCSQLDDGSPVPTYANQGKGTAFCTDQATLDKALASANDPASVLTALKANASTIADFAKNVPDAVKAESQMLVDAAHAAIAAGDGSKLLGSDIGKAALRVDSYCGIQSSTSS